jgi:hypothetical protein
MTIRQVLKRRARLLRLVLVLSSIGLPLIVWYGIGVRANWVPGLFLAAFIGVSAFASRCLRCPRCHEGLGFAKFTPPGRKPSGWFKPDEVDFCFYCGVSMNEPWQRGPQS